MPYIDQRIRAFNEAGDVEIQRKRSDGRMKTYGSAIDARAWCDSTEERRQYILDLVRKGAGTSLSLGKYIPIEAIIDILLANKTAEIKRLQAEIDELKKFIKNQGLSYKEKPVTVIEPVRITKSKSVTLKPEESARGPETKSGVGQAASVQRTASATSKPDKLSAARSDPGPQKTASAVTRPDELAAAGSKAGSGILKTKSLTRKSVELTGAEAVGTKKATPSSDEIETRLEDLENQETKDEKTVVLGESVSDNIAPSTVTPTNTEILTSDIGDDKLEVKDTKPEDSGKFSAVTSPEDQMVALKEKEGQCARQRAIALAAIEQLEKIKEIVEDKGISKKGGKSKDSVSSPRSSFTTWRGSRKSDSSAVSCQLEIDALQREIQALENSSSPEANIIQRQLQVLKKYCAELSQIQKENSELKRERDVLKNNADGAIKAQLTKLDQVTRERDQLRARVQELTVNLSDDAPEDDTADLTKRLQRLRGLEDEVRKLKDRAGSGGDSAEKEKLLAKIAALEKQIAVDKCKDKELELLRVENKCLRKRVDDLTRDHDELLKKTNGCDALKSECNELRAKAKEVDELRSVRQLLMKEIANCECCMTTQKDEIKRLACHIDCLTQNLDKQQEEMNVKVVTMKVHLEKKDSQLDNLSCETTCLRERIDELEGQVADKDETHKTILENLENEKIELAKEAVSLRTRVDELQGQVDDYEAIFAEKNESYKAVLENLENEKTENSRLEEALKKSITSDEHLKQMLKQAKCAVECITLKLQSHDIGDVTKLKTERGSLLKKIRHLQEELVVGGLSKSR